MTEEDKFKKSIERNNGKYNPSPVERYIPLTKDKRAILYLPENLILSDIEILRTYLRILETIVKQDPFRE